MNTILMEYLEKRIAYLESLLKQLKELKPSNETQSLIVIANVRLQETRECYKVCTGGKSILDTI